MPSSHTIQRAVRVARSMSSAAPVVRWLKIRYSAARPPIAIASLRSRSSFERVWRSSEGSEAVSPRALPRGMIVTLWIGSEPGSSHATRACPASW